MSFPLGPGVLETLYVPSKGEVSVFPSPVEFLQSNPDVLQSQILWGAPPPVVRPSGWEDYGGAQNSHSCGKTSVV